jgi:PKD repeat protein
MKRRIAWGLVGGLALILVITGCWFLGNLHPIAAFTATPDHGTTPLSVSLTASGSKDPDGTIVTFLWDFGDGQTASRTSSSVFTHEFTVQTASKVFTIILTVIDNLDAEDTACKNITVNPL